MVLVTFKTMASEVFKLEVDDATTVAEIKGKIQESKGSSFPVDDQRLIYNGKVLENEATFGSISYDPAKFVVAMVVQRRPPQKVETTATPKEAAPSTEKTETPAPEKKAETSTPAPVAPPAANPETLTEEQKSQIEAITAMGYAQSEVTAALKAAYWNAERAVEFLITGIPDDLLVNAAQVDETLNAVDRADEILDDTRVLDNLFSSAQFLELRELLHTTPTLLPTVLQELAAHNPDVASAIQANPQEFLRRLNQDVESQEPEAPALNDVPEGPTIVSLTSEQVSAVQRLKNMGFPEQLCIEAYIACDHNEEAAVNYILTRLEDDN